MPLASIWNNNKALGARMATDTKDFDVQSSQYYYEFGKKLGSGTYGQVLMARQKTCHNKIPSFVAFVAIKKATLRQSPNDPSSLQKNEMLIHEAKVTQRFNHPNIVRALEAFEDDSAHGVPQVHIAYEYCNAGDLLNFCNLQQPVSWAFEKLFLGLLDALALLEHHGIVHGDLKPDNVLVKRVGSEYVPLLADFGIARIAEPKPVNAKLPSLCLLEPSWMVEDGRVWLASPALDVFRLYITVAWLVHPVLRHVCMRGGGWPELNATRDHLHHKIAASKEMAPFASILAGPASRTGVARRNLAKACQGTRMNLSGIILTDKQISDLSSNL